MGACRCQRAFWEMFTGIAISQSFDQYGRQGRDLVSVCQHTCTCCISSRSVVGLFRYSVSERRWTQMLTSALEEGSAPHSRYHHASSLLAHESGAHGASHSFMLVVGGVTQDGVAGDTWSLNLSSLIWREHPVSLHLFPKASVYLGSLYHQLKFPCTADRARCCPLWRATP